MINQSKLITTRIGLIFLTTWFGIRQDECITELNKRSTTIYLYIKGPFEWKYQLLINRRKKVGKFKKLEKPKEFISYSSAISDVYENMEDYNPTKKRKALKVFDDMIADMESNNQLNPIGTKLLLIILL